MMSAVRWAVVLVMAATSAAALADGDVRYEATPGGLQDPHSYELNTAAKSESDGLGHGSGEPGQSAAQSEADEGTVTAAALRNQRQKDFLNEVWSTSP